MNYKEMIVSSYEAASNSDLGNKSVNEKNDVGKAEDLKSSNDDCRQEREHEQEKQHQQKQQNQQQCKKKENGEQQAGKDNEEDDEQEEEQLERSQTIESTISSLQSSVIVQSPIACNSTETTFIAPNSPSSSSSTSKTNGDSTFEPTVDMMVNDFDDEQTLEEEEALAAQECEDPTAELSNLQKESDMPIEELLALYNCNGAAMMHMNENRNKKTAKSCGSGYNKRKLKPQRMISSSSSNHDCNEENDVGDNCGSGDRNGGVSGDQIMSGEHNDEEEEDDDDDIDEGDDEDDDDDDDDNLKDSQLRKLYPETYGNSNDKRLLRTISRQQSDEEDDGEYSPDEDELKKTIMVGSEFQAVIPEGFSKYDDALPYENEDKLLWDPSNYDEMETEEYLQNSKALNIANNDNVPGGNHLRDDEQALYLLLQCGYNPVEALRRKRLNTVPSSSDEMSIWSEEECRNFESGVRVYGKDFYTIKHTKVRTRSVGELVQFYYLWKKTERHDVFANKARLEKKKYSLHPGLTDYMDRFLEEQDTNNGNTSNSTTMMNLRDRSSSPAVVNSLLQADTKRLKIHHHNQSSLSSSYHHHHHHYHGSSSNSLIGSSNNLNEKIMNRMSLASTASIIPTTSTATASTTIISKDNDNNINLSSAAMTTATTNSNRSQSSSLLASASSSSSSTTAATPATASSLSASNQDGGNSNAS